MKRTLRSRPQFSTNVRLRLLRSGMALVTRVAPPLGIAFAERLFFTPPPTRSSRGELMLREAERIDVAVDGRRVAAWRWGRGPVVALLHGWGGRAAQLTSFVAPLTARGLTVVALDAPGHGASGRGLSSAPQFARALRAVAEAVGDLHGVVAHSLGAAGAALAIADGLRAERVVFLAAAADPPRWAEGFAARLELAEWVIDGIRRRSERRIGRLWRDLHVPTLVAGLEAPLLVVHDATDGEVAIEDASAIVAASRRATLLRTAGLGHNGVLRDPTTVARVVDFLTEGPVVASSTSSGAGGNAATAALSPVKG